MNGNVPTCLPLTVPAEAEVNPSGSGPLSGARESYGEADTEPPPDRADRVILVMGPRT